MKKAWNNWLSVFYRFLQTHGSTISMDEFAILCDHFMSAEEPPFMEKGFSLYEMRIKRFVDDMNLKLHDDHVKHIAEATVESWQKEVSVDPLAVEILENLSQEYILGLVSNFDHPPHIHKYLKKVELDRLFNIIIISAEENVKKPDPAIFNRIFNKFKLLPSEIIFIGDSIEDMEAAKAAQIHFALIERSNKIESANARDFTISSDYEEITEFNNTRMIGSLREVQKVIDEINKS